MKLVNAAHAAPVTLRHPSTDGFLVLAAEVGRWAGPIPAPSRTRRRLLDGIGTACGRLASRSDVLEAVTFRGALRPPGEGAELLAHSGVRPARYDVVVQIRTADVDHVRRDWYLFNYFHGRSTETVFDVWKYTAGWFQRHTMVANSTLLRPIVGEPVDYRVINHASWPTLRQFLPTLALRPSFRSFVLANFAANGVAAQPIIYRVARREPGEHPRQQRRDEQHEQHP